MTTTNPLQPQDTPAARRAVRAAGLPRLARTLVTAAALAAATTQLTACFPVVAGAMAGGVLMATDRRPTATQTVDRGLQIEAESTINSRFGDSARVSVTVFNRKVLLTGEAQNNDVKQQIEQYVRGLSNAREVINEIEVISSPSFMTRSEDTYITSKVKTQLMTAEGVPSNSIKVVTEKGVVYLMGIVTNSEGDRATEVARNVGGVTKVVKTFDYVNNTERDRLDKAANSQNQAPVQTPDDGARNGLATAPATAAPAPSAPAAVTTSPVDSPAASPVPLPPGRNLP